MTNWYYKFKDEGRCTRCGHKLPEQYYYINCETCRKKHNRHVRDAIRVKRASHRNPDDASTTLTRARENEEAAVARVNYQG